MSTLIRMDTPIIQSLLPILLKDRSTNGNIVWATDSYSHHGNGYYAQDELTVLTVNSLCKNELQPRVYKSALARKNRTKTKAEVFTPSWICNMMNNSADEQWFGKKNVFNVENEDNTWRSKGGRIGFSDEKRKTWQDYVLSRRIEITCGEAPYLVSRYDTTTGKLIRVSKRIGMLDRKLRVVGENTSTEEEWFEWVVKAYQSTYGYEFQGDNLLIARINLMLTFLDYSKHKWGREPAPEQLKTIAKIISWNVWQMDGLSFTVPFGETKSDDLKHTAGGPGYCAANEKIYAKIRNWRNGKSARTLYFKDLQKGK